ncbi:MAG: hypothetical protein R6W83_11515 [Cryobacterium sp.]
MHKRTPLPRDFEHGAFAVTQASAAGLSGKRQRSSDLEHPFWGVCAPVGSCETLRDRCRAFQQRMPPNAFFSHVTAALIYGMPLPWHLETDPRIHVTVLAPDRAVRVQGVVGHAVQECAGVRSVAGLPVLEPVATWIQLAGMLQLPDLVAAGDHLLREEFGLATHADIIARVARQTGSRGCRQLRDAAALIRPRSESRQETLLRLYLLDCGFPEPDTNLTIALPPGRPRARGDLVYLRYRVLVEYDGEQHRLDDAQFNRDAERLHDLRAAGWLVITVRKGSTPEWVRAAVAEALRSRGWGA